ncbi:MAG: PEP-CTERM/exosortase system-associated acyltransferase [Rubrivivax sp.]|nr:PEP-CTERM/exosortase system-associated acyltransferase [Rubrivivax sp.]
MTPLPIDAPDFAPHFRSRQARPEADAPLMEQVHSLRFQVYCVECGFLSPEDYPDRQERDDRDAASAHFCSFNLKRELVGYLRLVPPDAEQSFPFQRHCSELLEGVSLPRPAESAEVSRLMVRQDYRRRSGDLLAGVTLKEDGSGATPERRDPSPQIMLSLYRRMYTYSVDQGIRYWYAAMERSLARALTRMNFAFRQVGPQTDYYGPVAPYLADLRELEDRVGTNDPALLEWLQRRDPPGC